jgi:hypothetical protein
MLLPRYYLGNQIQENEITLVYGVCGGQEKCLQGTGGGIWGKESMYFEDLV